MTGKTCQALILLILVSYSLKAQQKYITIDFKNITLESALTRLLTEQKVSLSFNPAILPSDYTITKSFTNTPVTTILDDLLAGTRLKYKLSNGEIIILETKPIQVTLSGHIKDYATREDIIGCSLYIMPINKGVSNNNYGYFAFSAPVGNYILIISHVGYKRKTIPLALTNSRILNIVLEPQSDTLKEVEITQSLHNDTGLSSIPGKSLSPAFFKNHPSSGGDPDIIKGLQMEEGVTRLAAGNSSLFIRGGNRDQNLILMDEAPVYNPAHLFGLVSIFNPDAINHIQLYKDDIPANFGGRLSSVVDTRMNEGNNKEFHIKGGASFLSARISAEGPIVKEKSSFLITLRRGLTDYFTNYLQINGLKGTYLDFNFKMNYIINSANRIFFSGYYGFDHLSSTNLYTNNWGNKTGTFRWNHLFNLRLFSNISVIYSDYTNQLEINAEKLANRNVWKTGIEDLSAKGDFTYYYRAENNIKFGFSGILHNFVPGEVLNGQTDSINVNIPRQKTMECAAYISHELNIGSKLQVRYGLRASLFQNLYLNHVTILDYNNNGTNVDTIGNDPTKTFFKLEPRLFFQFKMSKFQQLHFAYNRNYQYLQLLQNDELAFASLESWVPSGRHVAPQWSDYYSLGYRTVYKGFNLSLSEYYKKMINQLELINHAQIILNPNVISELRSGRSDAYGTEFRISKTAGKFNGFISYTWSTVNKKIASINNNKVYPANYNIPNNFKSALTYQITRRISLNSFFIYRTGRPVTLPVGYYFQNGDKVPIYEDKNASRFPNYKRLDLSIVINPASAKQAIRRWQSTWIISVFNVFNYRSPLLYKINNDVKSNAFNSGIRPAISYSFRY